jgi:isoleucyl-tRNA synthetase
MAPVMVFTSEEIWKHMPGRNDKEVSVHMAKFPEINRACIDEQLAAKWEKLIEIRGEATKALEKARIEKRIGHPLSASVSISVPESIYDALTPYGEELKSLLIVSEVLLFKDQELENAFKSEVVEGLFIKVEPAPGQKCERCWVYHPDVGTDEQHPAICPKCLDALKEIQE